MKKRCYSTPRVKFLFVDEALMQTTSPDTAVTEKLADPDGEVLSRERSPYGSTGSSIWDD
ncbi:MAG: hypothetical protein IJS97_07855 [Prevotella sp.]|nr:hypothetical protein [Prevotella sp.]